MAATVVLQEVPAQHRICILWGLEAPRAGRHLLLLARALRGALVWVLNKARHTGVFLNIKVNKALAGRPCLASLWLTFLFISHQVQLKYSTRSGAAGRTFPHRPPRGKQGRRQSHWPNASSFSGTIAPLVPASFSFLSSHCVPLFLPKSCKNPRPKAPHKAGRLNIPDALFNQLWLCTRRNFIAKSAQSKTQRFAEGLPHQEKTPATLSNS